MNRRFFSLSHRMGEGWGEGPLRFMVTTRVKNLRSSLPTNHLLFSLSHRMGEGWGEGACQFRGPKREILSGGALSRRQTKAEKIFSTSRFRLKGPMFFYYDRSLESPKGFRPRVRHCLVRRGTT